MTSTLSPITMSLTFEESAEVDIVLFLVRRVWFQCGGGGVLDKTLSLAPGGEEKGRSFLYFPPCQKYLMRFSGQQMNASERDEEICTKTEKAQSACSV